MPTFMSQTTFDALAAKRNELAETLPGTVGPSWPFVPWAGSKLVETQRGLYVVGIALAPEEAYGDGTYTSRLQVTEAFCTRKHESTTFWQFVDRLTVEFLGGPYFETSDRWGWSNIFKIAWHSDSPSDWPRTLRDGQKTLSQKAFAEETAHLRDSLILVLSADDYGVFGDKDNYVWNKDGEKDAGIWWRQDPDTRNLFMHGYHPKAMQLGGFSDPAFKYIVDVTRRTLPPL